MQFFKFCCRIIVLQYSSCLPWHDFSTHMHDVTINQLFIQNYTDHYDDASVYKKAVLQINLDTTMYNVNTKLTNSKFHTINHEALLIRSSYSVATSSVLVINCTFELITTYHAIRIDASSFNKTVSFINCKFYDKMGSIAITLVVCKVPNDCELIITNAIILTKMMLTL